MDSEIELVERWHRRTGAGTIELPFLPDPRDGTLPLNVAWLEYKHFSRRFVGRGKQFPNMPPWFTGLTRIRLNDKVALRKRTRLFNEIQVLAEKNNQSMEALIDTLMDTYKGKSVNAISLALGVATPGEAVDMDDDTGV